MAGPVTCPGQRSKTFILNKRIVHLFRKSDPQTVLLIILGGIIFTLGLRLEQSREEGGYPILWVAVHWLLVLGFCLWLGNLVIYRLVRRFYSWKTAFDRRFFLQLTLTLLFSLGCINLSYLLFKNHYTELPPDNNQLILLNIYGLLFLVPVLSIQFGLLFLQKWKRAVVEQERLQKAQIQSELLALRSHLSPHFLFNNLNVLSSLIDVENEAAQDYLDRFAEVYRYVLKNQEVELIELRKELQFLNAYIYLLQRRFSTGLRISVPASDQAGDYLLPPMALQMVLENALKHNKLSETEPLTVTIAVSDAPAVVIENNLRERAVPAREKTGFGLENIRRRYWLIARTDIQVEKTEATFSVALPLIESK